MECDKINGIANRMNYWKGVSHSSLKALTFQYSPKWSLIIFFIIILFRVMSRRVNNLLFTSFSRMKSTNTSSLFGFSFGKMLQFVAFRTLAIYSMCFFKAFRSLSFRSLSYLGLSQVFTVVFFRFFELPPALIITALPARSSAVSLAVLRIEQTRSLFFQGESGSLRCLRLDIFLLGFSLSLASVFLRYQDSPREESS